MTDTSTWHVARHPAGTLGARHVAAIRTLTELTTLELVEPRNAAALRSRTGAVGRFVTGLGEQDVVLATSHHDAVLGYASVRRGPVAQPQLSSRGAVDYVTAILVRHGSRRAGIGTALLRELVATSTAPGGVALRAAGTEPARQALLAAGFVMLPGADDSAGVWLATTDPEKAP